MLHKFLESHPTGIICIIGEYSPIMFTLFKNIDCLQDGLPDSASLTNNRQ